MTATDEPGSKSSEEIEVKLPCKDLAALRETLGARGATLQTALHDEINDLYDDPKRRLAGGGAALRLRRARGRTILTFKGPARFSGGIKIREERETAVEDAGQIEAILAGLGFSRRFRYEKRREEWRFERCTVALDETPIGRFVEVEGEPTAIRRAVVALGLDFAEAIPYSYARLYEERRRDDPSLPEDMVFVGREDVSRLS
ncbi:MAG TPA: class IV adenylate cyclase [Thermoanaerobaculia bacterium]|nr:class IV adenylate cyclase [Thermoanaerobaculia bacterium]